MLKHYSELLTYLLIISYYIENFLKISYYMFMFLYNRYHFTCRCSSATFLNLALPKFYYTDTLLVFMHYRRFPSRLLTTFDLFVLALAIRRTTILGVCCSYFQISDLLERPTFASRVPLFLLGHFQTN